jgi:Family of unknown function (DUF5677)
MNAADRNQDTSGVREGKDPSSWIPKVVRSPSLHLRRAVQLLDEGQNQLLAARNGLDRGLGQFESTHDSLNLLYLCIRHIDSVIVLATQDSVLWPAAITVARGAFETCVRSLWLVDADDPFEREGRWLGLLDSDVETRHRFVRRAEADSETKVNAAAQRELAKHFRQRHDQIKVLLAEKGRAPVAVPKMDAMMKATRIRTSYAHYVQSSQYAHGTLWATWAFRGGDWDTRSGKELSGEQSWNVPLGLCRSALVDPAPRVLRRLGATARPFRKNYIAQLDRAIAAVGE